MPTELDSYNYNIDPFFRQEQIQFLGFKGVDPRYFLIGDEDFIKRYQFDMSMYGIMNDVAPGLRDSLRYWSGGVNIPNCTTCSNPIIDSGLLRRMHGRSYCPNCFRDKMYKDAALLDKRKRLKPEMVYYLRVAGILNAPTVSTKRLREFHEKCRRVYLGI